ncbi:methyltransferase domain-containing protein [Streptomyces sp. Tu 2975]|uniref:class I SAM-dependent methyltransferase n=1 Tax=Streptomyces sp. Tu 2975 TaxID=2676871 RepID=UPI00244AC5A1|nr:methyltransferase domain-containing protein [Streptomyces sp. Tu 2975]
MTDATDAARADVQADAALKAKHRKMWALGDYPTLAGELIPELGTALVEACGVASGDKVLDIAAGTGNAAIPAALAGADVVACDLTPELLEDGLQQARKQGVELEWREADAEALPFGDGEFDTVMSSVGIMFALTTRPPQANCSGSAARAGPSA